MLKQISILILICFSSFCAFAQTEKYTAPVKWERYKVGEQDVSVLFPKLPILIQSSDVCIEQGTKQYAAYAEGIVFGLNIKYKPKEKPTSKCENKKKFDEENFQVGVKGIKLLLKTEQETKFNQNNLEVIKVKGELFTYWLINDYQSKRWFELWITGADETNQSVKNFVESIKIENNPQGTEIEDGSQRTLGDANSSDKNDDAKEENNQAKSENEEVMPIRIILKSYVKYTDAARQAQTKGTVSLRITFLANGGIGAIEIVRGLPYGLTEQAVAAARKIIFIPAKKNKINYSVVKTVEYGFSLY